MYLETKHPNSGPPVGLTERASLRQECTYTGRDDARLGINRRRSPCVSTTSIPSSISLAYAPNIETIQM